MAKPVRNARPDKIVSSVRTFFASAKTPQVGNLPHRLDEFENGENGNDLS